METSLVSTTTDQLFGLNLCFAFTCEGCVKVDRCPNADTGVGCECGKVVIVDDVDIDDILRRR